MKASKNLFLSALMLAALSAGAWAQTSAAAAPASSTVTAADVQALKDALAAQQQQIDRLTRLLEKQQQSQPDQAAAEVKNVSTTQASGATLTNAVLTQQSQQSLVQAPANEPPNPMHGVTSIYFKGITITPGGYIEAAFVRRSRALGADITTPFNSLTMPGASQSQLSEFFGSARQSKATVYLDGHIGQTQLSAYLSGDFLSSGDTSNSNQTNSYTLRLRQAWGQVKFENGLSFVGGQMWSLLTEDKQGIATADDLGRTNDTRPMTIDPQYNVGFTFARQYGIRVAKDFNHKVAVAFAVENAAATVTTHNNADDFLLGSEGATNSFNDAVTGCSLSNYTVTGATSPTYYVSCSPAGTYSFNPSPDLIAKVAFDPGFGHYEVFGLYDRFRDRVFPCADLPLTTPSGTPCPNGVAGTYPSNAALGAYNVSKNGGGFGANARWHFYDKHITFGLHAFGGSGVGRYGAGGLADLAINANGSPALIRNGQGLASLEWHGKKLDVYLYTGAEYDGRQSSYDPNLAKYVGYGNPNFSNKGCYTETAPSLGFTNGFNPGGLSNCTSDTRALIEGTAGFWYRFYNGPHGRFQFGTQYSYVTRQTWSGVGPTSGTYVSPEGLDGMVYTSFRYYLP
jgi:hypothetical protein